MDSTFWYVMLFAVLLLALLGTVAFLQVLQSRQNRESMTFLSKLQETSSEATRNLALQMLQQLSSQSSSDRAETLSHLQMQTEQVMQLLSGTVTQVTGSMSSTANRLSEIVSSSQAMIASKDAMAYQVVRGASTPFPADTGTGPYTSTDDLAQADAEAQARKAASDRAADEALALIRSMAGVQNVDPYPAAGTGLLGAPNPAG